jgi:hypothetical protein
LSFKVEIDEMFKQNVYLKFQDELKPRGGVSRTCRYHSGVVVLVKFVVVV